MTSKLVVRVDVAVMLILKIAVVALELHKRFYITLHHLLHWSYHKGSDIILYHLLHWSYHFHHKWSDITLYHLLHWLSLPSLKRNALPLLPLSLLKTFSIYIWSTIFEMRGIYFFKHSLPAQIIFSITWTDFTLNVNPSIHFLN
jgi:hypothetical protein